MNPLFDKMDNLIGAIQLMTMELVRITHKPLKILSLHIILKNLSLQRACINSPEFDPHAPATHYLFSATSLCHQLHTTQFPLSTAHQALAHNFWPP